MAAPVTRQRQLPNLPHKYLLSSHNVCKTRPYPKVLPVCSPKSSFVFVKITFNSWWTLAVPELSSCRIMPSISFCWRCNSPWMAWQLEVCPCAMLWHTCQSLSTQLCFFSPCSFLSYSSPLSVFYSNFQFSKLVFLVFSLCPALYFSLIFSLFLSQMTTQGSRGKSTASF